MAMAATIRDDIASIGFAVANRLRLGDFFKCS